MRSINLRQLRDTRQVKAWLKDGETIELQERGVAIAQIMPVSIPPSEKVWPDFAARAKALFGDKVIPAVDLLLEQRNSERY